MKKIIPLTFAVMLIPSLIKTALAEQKITIDIQTNHSHKISKNTYGVNNFMANLPITYDGKTFTAIYKDLGKPFMRFPGGTFGNYWNWETGLAQWNFNNNAKHNAKHQQREKSFTASLKKRSASGLKVEEFLNFSQSTKAKSVFMLNICGNSAKSNQALAQKIKNTGGELTHIELGNELYFSTYNDCTPDGESYVKLAVANAKAVKEIFPKVKIGVVIPSHVYTDESFIDESNIKSNKQDRKYQDWMQQLSTENFFDAVIIHLYSTIGMSNKVKAADFIPSLEAYEYSLSHLDGNFDNALTTINNSYPDKEVWVTEYHVGGFSGELTKYRLRHQYLGGLYAAYSLLRFYGKEDITVASWHNLPQWYQFPRRKHQKSKLIEDINELKPKVNGQLFKMFSPAVHNSTRYSAVSITGHNNYTGRGDYSQKFPDINAGLFHGGKNSYLMIINKHNSDYDLQLPLEIDNKKIVLSHINDIRQLSPDKNGKEQLLLTSETKYKLSTKKAKNNQIKLPPFSMTLISLNASIEQQDR